MNSQIAQKAQPAKRKVSNEFSETLEKIKEVNEMARIKKQTEEKKMLMKILLCPDSNLNAPASSFSKKKTSCWAVMA